MAVMTECGVQLKGKNTLKKESVEIKACVCVKIVMAQQECCYDFSSYGI